MNSMVLIGCLLFAQADSVTNAKNDGAKKADLAQEVKRLVKELDADDLKTRDAAEKQLIGMGPDVLDRLPQITPRTAAEVKERLGRVRKALQNISAESVAKETLVTLSGKMKLEKVIEELAKQTGNRVVGFEDRNAIITADFDKVPFWSALDRVLDQASLNVNIYGGEPGAITLEARPDEMLPRYGRAAYAGLFRFEPVRMEAIRDLRNPSVNGLQLTMEICWEPRLRPIVISQDVKQLEIKDEKGEVLKIENQEELAASVESDISAVELTMPLQLPNREIRKIGSIKGTLDALLPGRVEAFEFDKLEGARDVEKQKAGVTVVLEEVRKNLQLFEIRILVRFDDASIALESHRSWIYNNEMYVVDAKGERIESAGFQTTRSDESEVGAAYLFDLPKGLKGCKVVYTTPVSILKLPVAYEVKDLELP